jgi:uncharacterized protein YvpB
MEHIPSFAGSPLIPLNYLAISFAVLAAYLVLIYLISGRKRRKFISFSLLSFVFIAIELAIIGGYWLLPKPQVLWTNFEGGRIEVVFDKPLSRRTMEKTISPDVPGVWVFEKPLYATHLYREVVFYPDESLSPNTEYKISLNHIQNTIKKGNPYNLEFSFKLPNTVLGQEPRKVLVAPTVKLSVPAYLQQHTLSCEVASLKMALAFRGISVSEEELLAKVGVDSTPHKGNVWGNPYEKFVGNVNGTQMKDGYGVYWGPIARVAGEYRAAASFEGWTVDKLTQEIQNGNPVVIWTYAGRGRPTSWRTPEGRDIYAVRDEHTVLAVGFVGQASNPTQIIVNDPLIGKVYWSRASFDKKWGIFGNSGVVVY